MFKLIKYILILIPTYPIIFIMSILQLILLIMKGTAKSEFSKVSFGLRYPIRLFNVIVKN